MTVSNPEQTIVHYPGEWRPVKGCPYYEVCDRGEARSIDREVNGRQLKGIVLATRLNNSGYVLVNVRNAAGEQVTRTMHTLVLDAFAGPAQSGEEACHYNDNPLDNRWPENLRWDTKPANAEDKFRNGRPRAQPRVKTCPRCQREHTDPGRRCHPCVTAIGVQAADLLLSGVSLDDAGKQLDYPSEAGLLKLAQRYGRVRLVREPEPEPVTVRYQPEGWLRRTFATFRSR
jgi:HNH endonuclease/NUMOD4 motif